VAPELYRAWRRRSLPIDLDDLENMSVQMHGVGHSSVVPVNEFNPFTLFNDEAVSVWVRSAVDRPLIGLHVAAQDRGQGSLNRLFYERLFRFQTDLLSVVQSARR
jgi:hypothetical protein